MFAHALGMGLFEEKKLNWLEDSEWESSGYLINRDGNNVELSRRAIRRFEDLEETKIQNMIVLKHLGVEQVLKIIDDIIRENPAVEASDIAVIMLDKDSYIYDYINELEFEITNRFRWGVNNAIETKKKVSSKLFISNINNVKGLEFPFVICVTNQIRSSYGYRNSLYTMLTRSYLQSYLLVSKFDDIECQIKGLEYIFKNDCIRTVEPTTIEKERIQKNIVKVKDSSNVSFYDFINRILEEQGINRKYWKKFIQALPDNYKEEFDEDGIVDFINDHKKYYCI